MLLAIYVKMPASSLFAGIFVFFWGAYDLTVETFNAVRLYGGWRGVFRMAAPAWCLNVPEMHAMGFHDGRPLKVCMHFGPINKGNMGRSFWPVRFACISRRFTTDVCMYNGTIKKIACISGT